MNRIPIALGLLFVLCLPAAAQNTTCPDVTPGTDSSNRCANTRFVHNALYGFTPDLPLIGGATGGIAQGTRSGNTTKFATTSGALPSGNCVSFDANGNLVDSAISCSALQALLSGVVLAKTTTYSAVTGDCSKSITLGGSAQYTLTVGAASGFAAGCGLAITNLASETRTKTVAINGLASFFIYPGQTTIIQNQTNTWICISGCGRYKTPSTLAFFVRPDGSDSNDGLANSAAGAYLTPNACMAAISKNVDINQQSVGCQHTCAAPPCVITAVAQLLALTGTSFVGGAPYYIGDTATPSNVDFNPSSAVNADIQVTFPTGGGVINIGGFKFRGGANVNHGIYVSGDGSVNLQFPTMYTVISSAPTGGWPAGCGVTANSGGKVYLNATMFFNATIGSPLCIMNHGYMENGGSVTVDVLGGVWTSGFVTAKWNGTAALSLLFSNPGAVTGNRCNITTGGTVYTGSSGAVGFFPGNVNCSVAAGTVADAAGNRANYD